MAILNSGLAKSAAADAYTIDNSLRFNDDDSAYLSRVQGDGSRKTWTVSFWFKRGNLGIDRPEIFGCDDVAGVILGDAIRFPTSDIMEYLIDGGTYAVKTTQVFRDPSAWYHTVIATDTTQAVAANRVKFYVNGEIVTDFSTASYPTQDYEPDGINNDGKTVSIGKALSTKYYDGYLAEFFFVDGTALAADSFGELSSTTNQWIPLDSTTVKDAVTFGTNGFYQKYGGTELANSFTDDSRVVVSFTDTGSNSWTAPVGVSSIEYLVVAGGGGGGAGGGSSYTGGGGGAGGYKTGTVSVSAGTTYTMAVGVGGTASTYATDDGTNGGDSSISGSGLSTITATGGGRGSTITGSPAGSGGQVGGSGGGGGYSAGGAGTAGQGYAGGAGDTSYPPGSGGGGGGATAVGGDSNGSAGAGGAGIESSVTGSSVTYAGGGGGGEGTGGGGAGAGGAGGGGTGGNKNTTNAVAGTVNTGGGGGGGGRANVGKNGGSGIIVINYVTPSGVSGDFHPITANGDVTNTRAVRKIGDSSIIFDGSDSLSVADSTDWDFGSDAWTMEFWFRIDSGNAGIWAFGQSVSNLGVSLYAATTLDVYISSDGTNWDIQTGSVGMSPSDDTWYHFALVFTGSAYLNFVDGVLEKTTTSSTAIYNGNHSMYMGRDGSSNYLTGYMDEIRISNTARYTTTFTPSTTAFTADANTLLLIHSNWDGGLGADSSGNYNTFTPTNLVATDQMVDTPTNNFATWNPIGSNDLIPLTEGNLVCAGTDDSGMNGTFGMSDGKWYWESYIDTTNSYSPYCGITIYSMEKDAGSSPNFETANTHSTAGSGNTHDYTQTGGTSSSYFQDSADYIIAYALDLENGTMKYYEDNVLRHTDSTIPTDGSVTFFPFIGMTTSGGPGWHNSYWNFGSDSSFAGEKTSGSAAAQDSAGKGDFYYTPPSGYLALCTDNLSAPDIALPGDYFNTLLYTGTGATNARTSLGFQPDFTWIKRRSGTTQHMLFDSIRLAPQYLVSNDTDAEATDANQLESFDSDGFTVGSGSSTNGTSATFVGWNWKAGTTNSGSTSGSGTTKTYSSSTSATAGFSIIKYVGNGTTGHQIPHHMGVAPECLIAKNLDRGSGAGSDWHVWHTGFGTQDKYIWLNHTDPAYASSNYFNAVSGTTFSVGTDTGVNADGEDIVCYAFTGIEGYSKMGSYEGNSSSDGTFVYLGFKPAWLMIKNATTGGTSRNWAFVDSTRSWANVANHTLAANLNYAESSFGGGESVGGASNMLDLLSNGFKQRESSVWGNTTGKTFIYLAFAESPFKTSNAR